MGSEAKKEVKHLLVDLDGTLYRSAQLFADVRANIEGYFTRVLGLTPEDAAKESGRLYREYGLTVVGLINENYDVDLADWHKQVHGALNYEALLPKNPPLRELLDSLPMPKYIFTNADREHAKVCLEHIGIKECFEDIISFDCIVEEAKASDDAGNGGKVFCKPELKAFEYALKRANADAEATMFLDDSVPNIMGAKAAGLQTVLVGKKELCEGADHAIENFVHLKEAAPYLWQ